MGKSRSMRNNKDQHDSKKNPESHKMEVSCCIAGGGPAGIMLGVLLARAGVHALVLEKHKDFLRDFRGDTLHPSTLEIMHELGFLEDLLKLPHQKVPHLNAHFFDRQITVADFTHLSTHCRFIALMPQWDFLNFLTERGNRYPTFTLQMQSEVTDLIEEEGKIVGLQAVTADGPLEVRADLVVGADGRHSIVRKRAGLTIDALGAPMDVVWFRLSRQPGDPEETMGRFEAGQIFIMINRGKHWQCGYVIPKETYNHLQEKGITAVRGTVAQLAPFVANRLDELSDWDNLKLLTVRVDRLRQWYRQGLICIGDAAHAMSPVGGVGINLAIQDSVAAANLLSVPLAAGRVGIDDLQRVQRRRQLPTYFTQRAQVFIQNRIISRYLGCEKKVPPPLALRLLERFPFLRRIPGRMIGLGFLPEHVKSPTEWHEAELRKRKD